MCKVKIKLIGGGRMPEKKSDGAAAFDCYARDYAYRKVNGILQLVVYLGFNLEMPKGYHAYLHSRSNYANTGYRAVAEYVIDNDFRGEPKMIFDIIGRESAPIPNMNEACCQMIIRKEPEIEFIEVDNLSVTKRGDGGFGSTNNKKEDSNEE